ncbi:MAG: DUF11 domain-containing protein [Phycisphaerae bacterium]|nr:DUF11 domain-containing protein [Phycisphaerae bacterium]
MKALLSSCLLIAMACAVVGCQGSKGAFCGAPEAPTAAPQVKAQAQPASAKPECPHIGRQLGPNEVLSTYPCADCGIIRIEKVMPKQVNAKEPFEYNIIVTNLTDVVLQEVVVTERLADNFRTIGTKPTAKQDKQILTWSLPSLEPKGSKTFTVAGAASSTGDLANCTNATYYLPSCATTKVVQPQLALTHTAPTTRVICDEIDLKITVANKGTGPANNVKVSAKLPEGLTAAGAKTLDYNVGPLAAGDVRDFAARLTASKTGTYTLQPVASAEGDLAVQSVPTTTVVTQPALAITKTGPSTQFLGRSVEYVITVTNKGNAPAANTVVEDTLPGDIGDVRVSEGGVKTGSVVKWSLGTLAAGASTKLTVAYMPLKDGPLSNKATATAYCADAVSASAETVVKTISALLLEVIDLGDPIEVGKVETYRITVTNQGSAIATNITVNCTLETEFMQFVSASGATNGTLANTVVVFEPLKSLAPKAKAVWEVRVKAVKPGDVRFKVNMNSDQLGRDVEETEATNFYQ